MTTDPRLPARRPRPGFAPSTPRWAPPRGATVLRPQPPTDPHGAPLILQGSGASRRGRTRRCNQDRWAFEPELGLAVVCDGCGGHRAGERASELALEAVLAGIRERLGSIRGRAAAGFGVIDAVEEVADVLRRACEQVHAAAAADPTLSGMATTTTALCVAEDKALLAHVGDSRAWLLRDGALSALTHDHTVVAELVRRGRIAPGEAEDHRFRNVLSRAVGHQPTVEVETLILDLLAGDRLILATDGLYEVLQPARIASVVAGNSPQRAAEALLAACGEGGPDDATAVVVGLSPGGQLEAHALRTTLLNLRLEALACCPLFADLGLAERNLLVELAREERFVDGHRVEVAGEHADVLRFVIHGALRADDGRLVGPSGCAGRASLAGPGGPSPGLVAEGDTRCLALGGPAIRAVMQDRPRMGLAILGRLAATALEEGRPPVGGGLERDGEPAGPGPA